MAYTAESAREALAAGEATIGEIAQETGWPVVEKCLVPEPDTWYADDGNAEIECQCATGEDAAQEYVDDGDWGDSNETSWVNVHVWRAGIDEDGALVLVNESTHKVAVEPDEPDCIGDEGHDWQSPHSIVGGIKENPGVWGSGGSVAITEVCMRCGCGKRTDCWAQDPRDGEQGLTSIRYEPRKYVDDLAVTLTENWTLNNDGKILLSITDNAGAEVAGAIYDPESADYDTTSDGCGITCDDDHRAYSLLKQMDKDGEWPSPPNVSKFDDADEITGTLRLEVPTPQRRR